MNAPLLQSIESDFMYPNTQLFIDGTWCDGADGKTAEVHNPATGAVIGHYAMAEKSDLEAAVKSAERAFPLWRATSAFERSTLLRRAATLLRERAPELAPILTTEMGKPLSEATGEIMSAADLLDWFAEEARRVYGRVIPARTTNVTQLALKQPVGPVAAFTPWNFPLSQLVRKVGPALAAGCSIVAKPAEDTPAAPAALAQALAEAGLPAGVLNIVYGVPREISEFLIPHPAIRKISFTGSVPVGKHIAALAGQHMKRTTMELGGHSPVLVFKDANIEAAAKAIAGFKFRNAGQVCISPMRIMVERDVYDEFAQAFRHQVESLTCGDGMDPGNTMGPLVSKRRLEAVSTLVAEAVSEGAQVLTGGTPIEGDGFFYAPTILAQVNPASRILHEEPFGPVATLAAFDTIEDAITESNRLNYGLAAYAFTSSIRTSQTLQNEMETGMLAINHTLLGLPELHVGGVKDSGYGSEGGPEAIEAYLVTKLVTQAA